MSLWKKTNYEIKADVLKKKMIKSNKDGYKVISIRKIFKGKCMFLKFLNYMHTVFLKTILLSH